MYPGYVAWQRAKHRTLSKRRFSRVFLLRCRAIDCSYSNGSFNTWAAVQVRPCRVIRRPRRRSELTVKTNRPLARPRRESGSLDVEVMLRLDGENVKSVTPDKIASLLATKLRTSSARFSVQVEQSVPNIMHCTIRAQDGLDTAMRNRIHNVVN